MRHLGQVLYAFSLIGISFIAPIYTPTCHNEHLLTLERWISGHPPYVATQTTAVLPLLAGEFFLFQHDLPWVGWGQFLRAMAVTSTFLLVPLRGSAVLKVSYYGWALLAATLPFAHERQTFFLWFTALSLPIPAFVHGFLWGIVGIFYPMANLFFPLALYKSSQSPLCLQGFVLGITSFLALIFQMDLQTFYGQVYLPLMLPKELFSWGIIWVLSGLGYVFVMKRQLNLRTADRQALWEAWMGFNLLYGALGGLWGLVAASLYSIPRVPFLDKWNSRLIAVTLGIGSLMWAITLRDLPRKRLSLPPKSLVFEGSTAYLDRAPHCAQKYTPQLWLFHLKKSHWQKLYHGWEPPQYIWDPKGNFSVLRYYLPSLTEHYRPTQEGWVSADNRTPTSNTPSVSENSRDQN
ncbi:MAG: hypothetical protein ACUVRD_06285 [Bacteroidia bacterium]